MEQVHPDVMDSIHVKVIRFASIESADKAIQNLISISRFVRFDARTKKSVYKLSLPLPRVKFQGTVKLHGANCAIIQTRCPGRTVTQFQSRNKILQNQPGQDFIGFAAHMSKHQGVIDSLFSDIFLARYAMRDGRPSVEIDDFSSIAVFGEWCGGSVQKNIALEQFETMFIIFAVKITYHPSKARNTADDQVEWMDPSYFVHLHNEDARIFNVQQFKTFEVTMDLGKEDSIAEGLDLMKKFTWGVQQECPVARALGAKNVLVNGEGIVWRVVDLYVPNGSIPNPNLKLENFAGPGRWMKTRDVKAPSGFQEVGPKTPTNKTRSHKRMVSPELEFIWNTKESPEVPGICPDCSQSQRSPLALTVAVKWPSDDFPSAPTATVTSNPKLAPIPLNMTSSDPVFVRVSSPDPEMFGGVLKNPRSASPFVELASSSYSNEQLLARLRAPTPTTPSSPSVFSMPPTAQSVPSVLPPTSGPSVVDRFLDQPMTGGGITYNLLNGRASATPYVAPTTCVNSVDEAGIYESVDTLVEFICPEERLRQALHMLDHEWHLNRTVNLVGLFIYCVVHDTFKEQQDCIVRSNFLHGHIYTAIANKCARWYLGELPADWWATPISWDWEARNAYIRTFGGF